MRNWQEYDFKVLFSEQQIARRIQALGAEISRDYAEINEPLVVVAMLRGSLYFVADLTRAITVPLTFDFIGVGTVASGELSSLKITKELGVDIRGRHVLVLEEIVRTGLTTNFMLQNLETQQPASLKLAALMANEEQQLIDLPLAYVGFEIDYQRVVGYGMDFQDKARNLPFICELDRAQLAQLS